MTAYGVIWHPSSTNLGDDLQALAALRLTPRCDCVLDGDALDAPLGDFSADRLVTLVSGQVYRQSAHWPPEAHIAPVCLGLHFSAEDVWGVRLRELDGAGLRWLRRCGEIGCRDAATAELLRDMGLNTRVTGCLTLTLDRPKQFPAAKPYVCCVDVPAEVSDALAQFAFGAGREVRVLTHQREGNDVDFTRRMDAAQALLTTYAAAEFVVTRRFHCAMACLAMDVPVLLLYNSGYEDVTRFAPMDGMLRCAVVEDFTAQVLREGFPTAWQNPEGAAAWKAALREAAAEGLRRAEDITLPLVDPDEASDWRQQQLSRIADAAAAKIRRLEKEQFDGLHEKFTLLSREDSVKAVLTRLTAEPDAADALDRASLRRYLRGLPWYRRRRARKTIKQQGLPPEKDFRRSIRTQLARLGWPDSPGGVE